MLQWNSKLAALAVFAMLVALAATNSLGAFPSLNFTW